MDIGSYLPLVLISFCCELVDSSFGMGYGTTLTPLLLILGFEPIEVVPAVLFSEFVTGIMAAFFHHGFGNISLKKGSRDLKVALLLIGMSAIGVILAVIIAVNLPPWATKLYIGVIVLFMGFIILINSKKNIPFSWRRIGGLGLIAAFNKGISGGGYGPVVTGGQILSGVNGRNAIGIASLAEGVTSIIGVGIYVASGTLLPWHITLPLLIGAVLSVPLSAYVVSRISVMRITVIIGVLSMSLGSWTLLRLWLW